MQKNRPAKNHICFMSKNNQWQARTFLPLYDEKLVWAEDVNDTLCQHCHLACRCHPMVQDETNQNCFHKLCTLTVLQEKLIKVKEIS